MRTGQQVRAGENRAPRPASATAGLEVSIGTAGAARAGASVTRRRPAGKPSGRSGPVGGRPVGGGPATFGIRLLTAEEVSPLGDIRC